VSIAYAVVFNEIVNMQIIVCVYKLYVFVLFLCSRRNCLKLSDGYIFVIFLFFFSNFVYLPTHNILSLTWSKIIFDFVQHLFSKYILNGDCDSHFAKQ